MGQRVAEDELRGATAPVIGAQAFGVPGTVARISIALACLVISACIAKRVVTTPLPAPTQPLIAPACKMEGCCEGHGEVAYLQPDRFIMCTDGEPSQICDCH
jgi:hypothetical protein